MRSTPLRGVGIAFRGSSSSPVPAGKSHQAAGAEVILIDPQYAPRVLAKPHVEDMLTLIATAAKSVSVGHFHRFELMRRWYEADYLPVATFVSADGLHMNDWSYDCLVKGLALAIAEVATRPTATAGGRWHSTF